MQNLPDDLLAQIAQNVIAGFLAQQGMLLSEGGMEIKDYGPHRVFTFQSKVPSNLEESIDGYDVFQALSAYLECHNMTPRAVRFHPYDARIYVCTCGCGTFCFTSIYHTT